MVVGTITTDTIIITIVCTERSIIAVCVVDSIQSIWSQCFFPLINVETIVVFWAIHSERLVRPATINTSTGLQVDTKLHLFPGGQAVDVPEAIPELALQISEPFLICLPVLGEIGCATTDPSLDNYPATAIGIHLTSRIHLFWGSL